MVKIGLWVIEIVVGSFSSLLSFRGVFRVSFRLTLRSICIFFLPPLTCEHFCIISFVPEIYRLISRKTMADAGAAPTAAIPQGQGISLNAANVNAPEKKAGGCC